jgi:hypothetical protein
MTPLKISLFAEIQQFLKNSAGTFFTEDFSVLILLIENICKKIKKESFFKKKNFRNFKIIAEKIFLKKVKLR